MLSVFAAPDFPLVQPGDFLPGLLASNFAENNIDLRPGDVIVIAQKVVSKAENRYVELGTITPSPNAESLAKETGKDARLVELILQESNKVLRQKPGVIIVEHKLGYVHANAGIDRSNLPETEKGEVVLLLPEDPDVSAQNILKHLEEKWDGPLAVIISDSAGRAWRLGTIGMAIGTAGMNPLIDRIGERDLFNRELQATIIARADEIASAASLIMGEAAEAQPVVIVRGAEWREKEGGSESLLRAPDECLFR